VFYWQIMNLYKATFEGGCSYVKICVICRQMVRYTMYVCGTIGEHFTKGYCTLCKWDATMSLFENQVIQNILDSCRAHCLACLLPGKEPRECCMQSKWVFELANLAMLAMAGHRPAS
jgi:hypothetical protein